MPAFSQVAATKPGALKRFDLTNRREIEAHRGATPPVIARIMEGGWTKVFPLTELTTAKMSLQNREREEDKTRMVLENGGLVAKEKPYDYRVDWTLDSTDFIITTDNLVRAVADHFVPRDLATLLAKQLETHASTVRKRDDFKTNANVYVRYFSEVMRALVEERNFDVSFWQEKIYMKVCEEIRSEKSKATIAKLEASMFWQPAPQNDNAKFRTRDGHNQNKGSGPPQTNTGADGGKCMYCAGPHKAKECKSKKGKWCVRSGAGNKFRPPIDDLRICWAWNERGCTGCIFVHACSLCGEGAKGQPARHGAQTCTA